MIATCATLAALVLNAPARATISLSNATCTGIVLKRMAPGVVTIKAGGSTMRGLTIAGSNIRWRSGTIVSPKGVDGKAAEVYGLWVRGNAARPARNVRVENVRFGFSRKAAVIDGASDVTIADSRFDGYGEDGIIVSATVGLDVLRNRFVNIVGKATSCTTAGRVIPGLSSRDCKARRGAWADGFHTDAIQMRNGVENAVIRGNTIRGKTQGITQMDTAGDAPLKNILVEQNEVWADIHHITLGGEGCISCRIERNKVRRFAPDAYKAVIRSGPALRCGNDVQDEKPNTGCL